MIEQGLAAGGDVTECLLEIACVPRVCHIARASGKFHHTMNLVHIFPSDNPAQKPFVRGIHNDYKIGLTELFYSDPVCSVMAVGYSVPAQGICRIVVDAIAFFLIGYGSR